MRGTLSKTLRSSRYAVAGYGSCGRAECSTATTATTTPSTVLAAAATARERVALAVAGVISAFVRHQGCSRLAIALCHRRCCSYPRLHVSKYVTVGLDAIPRRDDLATVLAHRRDQPEVCALSTDGQLTPAATDTPVQPQLAIPSGAGDSATAASSFLFPLSVIVELTLISELELF